MLDVTESLIGLYADDMVRILSNIHTSRPVLLNPIEHIGSVSDFSVNWSKSPLMSLSDDLSPSYLDSLPFKICTDHLVYLGL